MRSEIIFLNIAGFIFQINIIPSDKYIINREITTNLSYPIKRYFKNFIQNIKSKKIDIIINIHRYYPNLFYKNNIQLIDLFDQKNSTLNTFQHISYVQFIIILRYSLQMMLANNSGFYLHGSASNFKNKAYLFLGQSNAGKTTISNLLSKYYPKIADDHLIIRKMRRKYYVFQSPFFEKNFSTKSENFSLPIDKIFFLQRSLKFTTMNQLNDKSKILPFLVQQLVVEKKYNKLLLLNLYDLLKEYNQFYNLFFEKNISKLLRILNKS